MLARIEREAIDQTSSSVRFPLVCLSLRVSGEVSTIMAAGRRLLACMSRPARGTSQSGPRRRPSRGLRPLDTQSHRIACAAINFSAYYVRTNSISIGCFPFPCTVSRRLSPTNLISAAALP